MSIGNLQTDGNKGNNFPWQLKMLMGQQCACDQLTAIADNTDDVEFLLSSILTTLQANTEYEAKFVLDTCNGGTVYLEVRVWNSDDSTWGPITYYLPGSDTPVIPAGAATPGCLQYTDPSGVLGLILGAIQAGNLILTDIETNTGNTVTELQSLLALYTAGQQACASSLSVTLCTEQGAELIDQGLTLDSIETNTSNINGNLIDIETLITTLNSIVSTEATLQSVLTELQGINLDTNGLSQEATQLLVLAAINTVISNTTGLAQEVTLNALLTAFNAEDFATETTLANIETLTSALLLAFNSEDFATETTLASLLAAFNAENFATETTLLNLYNSFITEDFATEATLALIEGIISQMTFTGSDLNVSANLQVGDIDVSSSNPVPISTLSLPLPTGASTEATLASLLTAFNAEDFATESTLALLLTALNNSQEFETKLVRDAVGGGILCEVRRFNQITQTFEPVQYFLPGSITPVVPLGSVLYLDSEIETNTEDTVNLLTPEARVHNVFESNSVGSVPSSLRGGVLNQGGAAGVWNGTTLLPGISISWDPCGNRDVYAPISFDATGTKFIIEYTT